MHREVRGGCQVTPGFIESHTHYDGTMWWQADLDPLPGYGATTMILGNCGFSPAPLHKYMPAQREMIGIFSFFEDIPEGPFMQNLPWDWNTWSEYRASVERNVKVPLNYAAYVGHIAIRLAAMGVDIVLKATKVDGIYTADPKKDPLATRYSEITFDEAISRNLGIMDATAFALCRDQKLPIKVFSIIKNGALKRVVLGEDEGTLVHA